MDHPSSHRRKRKPALEPRVMLDFFMGVLWMLAGLFAAFSKELFRSDFFEGNDLVQGWMKYFLGGIFVLYGLFRIYRGYVLYKERLEEN